MGKHIVFISHTEKDREFVRAFVDLLYLIGLSEDDIFCSSLPEVGVPFGKDIFEYLRDMLDNDSLITMFMLSDNYYDSVACLNEMGAVWVKQSEYFTLSLPGFQLKNIEGAINPRQNAIDFNLDNARLKARLNELKNLMHKKFSISSVLSESRWERVRDEFLKKIRGLIDEICVDINKSSGFCIGKENYGGCDVIVNNDASIVKVTYDFNKTDAECCSLVFFVGGKDVHNYQGISFLLKTDNEIQFFEMELHLKDRNIKRKIFITASEQWIEYSIDLKSYGVDEEKREELYEIAFLVYRNNIEYASLELKDLRIF